MNERDKELADEAEAYADRDFKGEINWGEAYESKLIALIRADEREALIRYFDGHWRSDWSDGQIIEALEARGNT